MPLVLIVAGLLAYHNSFTGPFIFDDRLSIQENPTIRHLWPISQPLSPPHAGAATVGGRPVINLSLAINYALGGLDVRGYHALNLGVHILAGLTLFGVVRRTLLQPRLRERFGAVANELALAVAVLWTVHPLQTESVTYIVQRAESIMGLFYLLTLYCFIRGAESPWPRVWYGLCLSACALGMASKQVMASVPLLVMLYDRAFVSRSFREAWRRRWPLYLALASTWILLGYLVFFHGSFGNAVINAEFRGVTWWQYLLTEPGVILHYLRLAAWPDPLCLDYYGWPLSGSWASILLPALVIAILLGATAWAWKTNSAWGVLGAWFFLILAPSSSFIPLDSPAYEHRMYLALAAVVVLAVMGIHAVAGRRTVAVVAVLAVGLGVLTVQRNQDYRSSIAIWGDTVAKRPGNPRAQYNLGCSLQQKGRMQEAMEQWEQALRLKPDYAEAQHNLGLALSQVGKFEEAIGHYEQALRIKPDFAEAHNNLGLALSRIGKIQEAIGHYEQALRIQPDFPEAQYNLGLALARLGSLQEAIGHYEQALRLKPDYAEVHYNLGCSLQQEGRMQEAMQHWEQALRSKPDYAETENNLAWLLATLASADGGDPARAVTLAERACELTDNRVAGYLDTLAAAYAAAGRFNEAIATAQKAIELARSAGQTQIVNEIETRLELYRAGRAYRAPASVTSPRGP